MYVCICICMYVYRWSWLHMDHLLSHLRVLKKESVVALLKGKKELRSALVYVVMKNRRVKTYTYKDTRMLGVG